MTIEGARPLVLFGPPGAGKSTVARLVARRLGRPLVDLDETIERTTGRAIADLFASGEEPRFRELERAALLEAIDRSDAPIVAAGGGALVHRERRDRVHERASVVVLDASSAELARRLGRASTRPLLASGTGVELAGRLATLVRERREPYADAPVVLDTNGKDASAIAELVVSVAGDSHAPVKGARGDRSFVHFTDRPWAALLRTLATADASSIHLVTDENVVKLHAPALEEALGKAGVASSKTVLPAGELHKRWPAIERIVRDLLAAGADRRSVLVALGGGVVTDIGGFAASMFMRGIRWIAVPTTTLAMVDAAIGGKTGVDFDMVKNVIGAFHPPLATIVAPAFTETETLRAVRAGLSEAIKTFAVADARAFEALEALGARCLEPAQRCSWIVRAARAKAAVVSEDPREEGRRIFLNFGHTLGHAIESAGGFDHWTHGEAVALGMVAALRLGVVAGATPPELARRVETMLATSGLPTSVVDVDLPALVGFVANDKKRLKRTLRFVLLHALAEPVVQAFDMSVLARMIEALA